MNSRENGWIEETRSNGVVWFGVLLVVGALMKVMSFLSFEYYQFLFQPLSSKEILIRYIMSWSGAIIGLVCGVGVLALRNIFRKIAILLCFITLITLYWKHPAFVFRNVAVYMEHEYSGEPYDKEVKISKQGFPMFIHGSAKYELEYESFPHISRTVYSIYDLVFCLAFIIYFRRKNVKEQFV